MDEDDDTQKLRPHVVIEREAGLVTLWLADDAALARVRFLLTMSKVAFRERWGVPPVGETPLKSYAAQRALREIVS